MKKKLIVLMIGAAMIFALSSYAVAKTTETNAPASFKDVSAGHWAAKDIQIALDRGFVSGYPDGTFKPGGTITRAEAAGMLSRITKLVPDAESKAFADLEGHWAKDQVRKLVALGFIDPADYVKGFEPDKAVTRFELMKWIASGLAKSEPDFAQALIDTREALLPTPETYMGGIEKEQIPYIALVRGTGIILGFEDLTFRPANTTTRAEVVSTLLRYEKVEGTKAKDYTALNELREVALTGTNMFSVTNFKYMYYDDTHTDFQGIKGKPITGNNKLATLFIHKMIFIPLEGSIYFDLFISPNTKEWLKRGNGESIAVIEEITFTANVDKLDTDRYVQEFTGQRGGLVAWTGPHFLFAQKQGFNTSTNLYNAYTNKENYLKKGESIRVWFQTGVDKNNSHLLLTDEGFKMRISDED